jgi:hypothetical protein
VVYIDENSLTIGTLLSAEATGNVESIIELIKPPSETRSYSVAKPFFFRFRLRLP